MFGLCLPEYDANNPLLQEQINDAQLAVIDAAYELYDSPYGPNNIWFHELRDNLIVANSELTELTRSNHQCTTKCM